MEKDAVSISPASQQSWKWDNKNNYYRVTGDFTPSFGDAQTYTKRSGASSVNVDTGKSMGTIHFSNSSQLASKFYISVNRSNYAKLQSSKTGQLKASRQYTGYKRRHTKYLYAGSGSGGMQPITMLQFDGDPVTRSVNVTVNVPRTPVIFI